MDHNEHMSEESPTEGSMSEGEPIYAEDISDEEDNDEDIDDEDDSDDILEDFVEGGRLGSVGMDGSESDVEYGRGGFFFPFHNDLILPGRHKERYGSGNSYKLSVPRSSKNSLWMQMFEAALNGTSEAVRREWDRMTDLAEPDSCNPPNRDFPLQITQVAADELKQGIGHHICDSKYALF